MSFTIHDPKAIGKDPEYDCIFCDKPALISSEAGSTATTRTVEVFCRHCGARKTMTSQKSADGKQWETVD